MFWKKKNKEALFTFTDDDKRENVRVAPPENEAISLNFETRTAYVNEISASGLSYECDSDNVGDRHELTINIPGETRAISATIEVASISSVQNFRICGCRFVNISCEAREAIHHYVLLTQKTALQKNKNKTL